MYDIKMAISGVSTPSAGEIYRSYIQTCVAMLCASAKRRRWNTQNVPKGRDARTYTLIDIFWHPDTFTCKMQCLFVGLSVCMRVCNCGCRTITFRIIYLYFRRDGCALFQSCVCVSIHILAHYMARHRPSEHTGCRFIVIFTPAVAKKPVRLWRWRRVGDSYGGPRVMWVGTRAPRFPAGKSTIRFHIRHQGLSNTRRLTPSRGLTKPNII